MKFMEQIKKITLGYSEDEDDFFEGADMSSKPPVSTPAEAARDAFESTFAVEHSAPAPEAVEQEPAKHSGFGGSIFGNLGKEKAPKAKGRDRASAVSGELKIIMFAPKGFEDAKELAEHLEQGRNVMLNLEGLGNEQARRLLDFSSGITYALEGTLKFISGKTYMISPGNVDILGAQSDPYMSAGEHF